MAIVNKSISLSSYDIIQIQEVQTVDILAKRLKTLREEKNLTQEILASELGLRSKSAVANYESGLRNPDYDTLLKIARYFGVTTDYLLGNSEQR